jgi:hypothetical protein
MRTPQLWPSDEPFSRLADLFDPMNAQTWCGGTITDKYGIVEIQLPYALGGSGIDKTGTLSMIDDKDCTGMWDELEARDPAEYQRVREAVAQAEATHKRLTGSPISWILLPALESTDTVAL